MTGTDVKTQVAAAMGSEGSERFIDSRDYIPAINFAINELVLAIDAKIGGTKFSEEALRFLRFTDVFETSKYSRIQLPANLWTLELVYPKPTYIGTKATVTLNDWESRKIFNPMLATPNGSANLLSDEEWADTYQDPFAPGFPLEPTRTFVSYGYRNVMNYGNNASYFPNNYGLNTYTWDLTDYAALSSGDKLNTIFTVYYYLNGALTSQDFGPFTSLTGFATALTTEFNDVFTTQPFKVTPTSRVYAGITWTLTNPSAEPEVHPHPPMITGTKEIELRPVINRDVVGLVWTRVPQRISALTDTLEFGDELLNVFESLAIVHLLYKESDSAADLHQKAMSIISAYLSEHYN